MCSLSQDLSNDTINFEHVTLTVTVDLNMKNINSAHNFLTIRHGAFILGVCIPYIVEFFFVYQDLSGGNISFDHMNLIVTFDVLSKNLNMAPNLLP